MQDESGDLCGFLTVERYDLHPRKGFIRKVVWTEESVYRRVWLDPDGEWDDGESPLEDTIQELDADRFMFVGVPYHVVWPEREIQQFLEKWIFG
jgi:hypothetical protein